MGTARFYLLKQKYSKRYDTLVKRDSDNTILKNHQSVFDNTTISDNEKKLLNQLSTFEEDKGFLENGITLNSLAKKLETNSSYLSKVINQVLNKNFSNYINDLRIEYAVVELQQNTQLRVYSVNGMAEEFGYNTAESFSKAFKRKTGIYPSYFIKKLKEENILTKDAFKISTN